MVKENKMTDGKQQVEQQLKRFQVTRTDKHSQAIKCMTFADGVNDLASIMPASIYSSRLEVAADLLLKGHIETLGYVYEIAPVIGIIHNDMPQLFTKLVEALEKD